MKIGADEVRHVAKLAELAVDDADVPVLAAQLQGIVDFVAQLGEVDVPPDAARVTVGPDRATLREDAVRPIPLARGPQAMAPAFEQGFFVVPKLGGLAEE